ncbi:MAG: hypothetical protein QNJ31_07150 [Candidatus Caenarcaniphilales bacterium]|nr:hypothetical protein [Candidatus Caenarcaniphilales bacterium]
MTVPISHGTRLINARRNKLSQLDLFTSLRNDIAYVVLGIMTYTLPILFLDDLGRRIAESMAIKDIASGKLHVQSNKDLKDICKYLGALIGLLFGLITNDVGRATIRSNAEKFAGGFLETKEGFLKFCRFNVPKLKAEIKAIKKEEAVPGFVSS